VASLLNLKSASLRHDPEAVETQDSTIRLQALPFQSQAEYEDPVPLVAAVANAIPFSLEQENTYSDDREHRR
jgi:hypothetical protein